MVFIDGVNIMEDSGWIYNSSIVEGILSGKQLEILNIDMRNVVERFNHGDYNVLKSEEVDTFLNMIFEPDELLKSIIRAKEMLTVKNKVLEIIEEEKKGPDYNPDERRVYRFGFTYYNRSYRDIINSFDRAEAFINNDNTYRMLKYCLKYYELSYQIKKIKKMFDVLANNPEKSAKLLETIKKGNTKIGLIKIDDSKNGIDIRTGTETEVNLSNDILMGTDIDDKGFILFKDYAVIITKQELLEAGVNPKKVGWQPLSLKIIPVRLGKLYDYYTPLKERLGIRAKLILK